MWDYDYRKWHRHTPYCKYGTANADTTGALRKSEPFLEVEVNGNVIRTRLVGEYNLPNVLVAAAVGKYFKIGDDNIKTAIESYTPSNSRSQLIEKGTNKIILDAYNANPTSMKAAIENFARLRDPQKILVLVLRWKRERQV